MTDLPCGNAYKQRYGAVMMNTFGVPARTFVRGQGCYVWDADGNRYLDLLAGIAVNALGHAHPEVVAAVADQVATLGHVSNFFSTPPQIELGEKLAGLAVRNSPGATARVFFTNSGTEANEAAFKITRRTGNKRIIAMEGSFHGRTMGALALTAKPAYREPFEPLPGDVEFVPFGDITALEKALAVAPAAAVVMEPIQGEGGVAVPPVGYLPAVRELTRTYGALLWLDEVQTGIGRCGFWFAHDADGLTPDIITLAKGLGAGFPIGACIAVGAAADLLGPGSHGTTFGGNPLAARVAGTVLHVLERDNILAHVTATGRAFADAVLALGLDQIVDVRGAGLLRGVVLRDPIGAEVAQRALDEGFVINSPRPDVLRIVPPLIIEPEELEPFVAALPRLLQA